jgi:hypothetical protein
MAGGEGKLKNHGFLCVFMGCFSEISLKYGRNGTTENQLYCGDGFPNHRRS